MKRTTIHDFLASLEPLERARMSGTRPTMAGTSLCE